MQQKGGNHLHFTGQEYKGEKLYVLTAEARSTTSAQLKNLFVKEVHFPVQNGLVRWENSTTIVTRETIPLSLPTLGYNS